MKGNFFATSHGKGAVDGIGGTVKPSVWREVRNGHVDVNTAEQYSIVAQQRNRNIHVHFISKTEIEAIDDKLTTVWEGVVTISGTHKYHFFETS